MGNLNFHVRHEVTPERTWEVLVALITGQDYSHVIQAYRQLKRLQRLGLVTIANDEPTATTTGVVLYQISERKPEVTFELLHYLHYTRWDNLYPLEYTTFWSYQTYCCLLYEKQECNLDSSFKKQVADEINTLISNSDTFGPHVEELTRKGAISISHNTLNGIQHWLTALTPPVIERDVFTLRYFCPPELLLMALAYVYKQAELEADVEMLLMADKRETICRLCLLTPQALDRSLDWMLPLYPQVIQPGTRTGSYGRSIRLLKIPTFGDMVL